ncbi:TonB-dependent receptor [Rhodobacteraceae bacterium RKSG542]|uniref:TonB-dependent receptor n=1 Tax=Pseudovibrio flavus TaxID=2529854 RepID=UPI0012BB5AD8|nr:TonB-dependent receptor [Pseudovibrio flavus]MTI18971.1 TonB-dependent receptor [Pseudovibrio flavus]
MKKQHVSKRASLLCLSVSAVAITAVVGVPLQNAAAQSLDGKGFAISLDAAPLSEAVSSQSLGERGSGLPDTARIDIRYDGLKPTRILNVSTSDLRSAYQAGETLTFRASSNYPAYIDKAEVRVIDLSGSYPKTLDVLPVAPNGEAQWVMPVDGGKNYAYALRVYDASGRYDETFALPLDRTTAAFESHETTGGEIVAAGEGEDRTRRRAIPVIGGVVVVSGQVDPQQDVTVMGEAVPVTASGEFVISRNIPAGSHSVDVEYTSNGKERSLIKEVEVPESDWHYVAIADVTVGRHLEDTERSADPYFEKNYAEGRLAYYVSGITKNGWSITSSADTGEGDIEDILTRLDDKDPRAVIARLDQDDLYPTYGDDSSSYDDTPSSGRVYLRAQRGQTQATWGDFTAEVEGSELLNNTRKLYGGEVRSATAATTASGDARLSGVVYGAQPGTLPQTDILRGTGGSLYFLSRQDINGGSESVSVQTIDPDTGRVIATRNLAAGSDYELDYMQGVIKLAQPLNSSSSDGGLASGTSGAYDVNLVVQYEYTPLAGDVDGYSFGGRAEAWVNDHMRLGATAMKETTGLADQKMLGADLRFQMGQNSFLQAEIAQTDGPGFGRTVSSDGGLTLTDEAGSLGREARAYSVDSHVDFGELDLPKDGFAEFYMERIEGGFATLNQSVEEDQFLIGGRTRIEVSDRLELGLSGEHFESDLGNHKNSAEVAVAFDIDKSWRVEGAYNYLDQLEDGKPEDTGTRSDVSARLTYELSDDAKAWLFGQVTAQKTGGLSRDDRYGIGAEVRVSEKLVLSGEVSDGTDGVGAAATATYTQGADREVYFGYSLDPTRTLSGYNLVGDDMGKVVVGSRYRHSDQLTSYAENAFDLYGDHHSQTRAYGITYSPVEKWSFSGALESGVVRDKHNGDLDRNAYSLGVVYNDADVLKARSRVEYRSETGDGANQDADTWAATAGFEYKRNENARLLGSFDALLSENSGDSFRDGEYIEASLGYAYRPIEHERLNMLFKYSYLYDLPGADQVTVHGDKGGDAQRSHVLSVDLDYDLSKSLTLGAKYGYRRSEVAERGTTDFQASTAHLGIARLDWHVVKNWDAMVEGRLMYGEETDTFSTGALLGVYRHIGEHVKVGVGYEWGNVSEDLTDLNYTNSGVFLNLVAKM